MFNIPERFESERLLIRSPLWGDGEAVNEGIRESLRELQSWMPWAQSIPAVEETECNLRQARLKFLEANRIQIRCDALNSRSYRIAERAGFTLEGTLRKDSCGPDGSLRDTMVFSKVRGVEF